MFTDSVRAHWQGEVGEVIGEAKARLIAYRRGLIVPPLDRQPWPAPTYGECMLRAQTCAEASDWQGAVDHLLVARSIVRLADKGLPTRPVWLARWHRLNWLLPVFFDWAESGPVGLAVW